MWNENGVTKKKMKKSTIRFIWSAVYFILAVMMTVTMLICYSGLPGIIIALDVVIIIMDLIYCSIYIAEGLIYKKDENWEGEHL